MHGGTQQALFCSDTVSFKTGNERLYIRAYPNCSNATIFSLSEQALPATLLAMSMLWAMFSWLCLRRGRIETLPAAPAKQVLALGNLSFSVDDGRFYGERDEEIYFTPMQLSLMRMLMTSEDKRVSVDGLCASLWPKKENARETLYTLVRRLRPILERHSNLRLVAEKGGYYALSIQSADSQ